MTITLAENQADLAAVRELWEEYWKSFGLPDDFQDFREELHGLPGVYGLPGGAIFLAREDHTPAGTIALRRLNATAGEVKRLYIRPDFRGRRLAQRLIEAMTQHALTLGYDTLYADTLPAMIDAIRLYEKLGFDRTEAYSNTPTPGAIFLKKKLVAPPL